MKKQFDEPTRRTAQYVTRRTTLKQFGVGLAGMTVAALLVVASQAGRRRNPDATLEPAKPG